MLVNILAKTHALLPPCFASSLAGDLLHISICLHHVTNHHAKQIFNGWGQA